jgi:hypothetical protein
MPKAARDDAMTRLSPADRDHLRHLMQDVRTHTAASRPGDTVRQMLTAQGHTVLVAVGARDAMGPQVGTSPPDFCLKRLGTEERVRLSSFRGQRPVALVFGSYT